jgi:hypothetical protein
MLTSHLECSIVGQVPGIRILGNWVKTIPFQTNRGVAKEVRCFQGFELAENGSQEDSGTGPTFAEWKQRNRQCPGH